MFDSGLGGISVLRELIARMPNESYLYYGDSANAPYGTKSLADVRELTLRNIGMLYQRGIKAAVIACNTATSAAVSALRERFRDIPVIGMEPALKPAALAHPGGTVLVLATPLTLREEKFTHLMEHYQGGVRIVPLACPELVEFVERGELESEALLRYLHDRLDCYRASADAAVLGCTHFPFLKAAIRRVLGPEIALYDGGQGTARQTQRQLSALDLLSISAETGTVQIENSRNSPEEAALSNHLLAQIL